MHGMSFVADYKDDDVLRKSFGKLALEVFGIDFEGVNYQITSYNDSDDVLFVYPEENAINGAFRHPVTAHA